MSIKESAGILKLPFIKNNYEECIKEALLNDWNYEDFLEKILNQEIHVRKQNSINNRIRNARFPYRILLDDYKREHLSIEIRQKIKELETL